MKFILIAALLLNQLCYAQPQKYLAVNDAFPPAFLPQVLGQEKGIDLNDYQGKLLIIDFWGLGCISCIASFPKLDSLQLQFGDRLQIVLVTRDPRSKVEAFFAKKKIKQPSIPIVVEDTVLSSDFYYEGVPHLVWINEKGKVQYITGGNELTARNLSRYFSGATLSFSVKKLLPDFNFTEPTWREGGGRLAHHVKYYSVLSGYLEEHTVYRKQIFDDSTGIYSLKVLNAPLLQYYQFAYGGLRETGTFARRSRILFELNDPLPFTGPGYLREDEWKRANSYCYEVLLPGIPEAAFCKFMQRDLERFFPYCVTIEQRRQKVFVLESSQSSRTAIPLKLISDFVVDEVNKCIELTQVTSTAIASRLDEFFEAHGQIFIDSSGNNFIGNLTLSYPFTDWKQTALELSRFGLKLTQKEMQVDMLVIRDKPALSPF